MQCEVCGRQIVGIPRRVIIEGAKMTTCGECVKLGSGEWNPEPSPRQLTKMKTKITLQIPSARRSVSLDVPEDLEITENYGAHVRQAREKMGLDHEALGRRIGEKVSVLKKIENGKIVPDQKLAAKLEQTLKIKLLVHVSEPETVAPSSPPSTGVTLGEIVQLKDEKRRHKEDEGDHSPKKKPI